MAATELAGGSEIQPPPPEPDASTSPETPVEPTHPDAPAPPLGPPPPTEPAEPAPSQAIELTSLGAFRQRGDAKAYVGLLLGAVIDYKAPMPAERLAGRVAVVRAPKDLDLASIDAPAQIDAIMAAVREAGALGCLVLTGDDGEQIERFSASWQRQVRRAGGAEQAMLIEGLLVADARKPIQAALADPDTSWVLDLDLATRSYEFEANNVLGRVTGRDRPDEAVVLTCHWDTPAPELRELHTRRLLATLGAFFQLAEWSRRSTPPPYSMVLVLTVDAGLTAGQSVHAAWSANFGARTIALLGLDRPSVEPLPAVALSGHYDTLVVERATRVVAADGHELVLDEQLSMPSLAPYLRYPGLVMTIGAPTPAQVEGLELAAADDEADTGEDAGESEDPPEDDRFAGLQADIRLLRNMMLALAAGGR
ncbi:hypothetical protein DB30_02627 [Enhygromyxa salina]|uniref:Peptidase M28 domain-containing protein n=1 Tax=Enhygromyxa salina TaxID=215803 RepID=A0A0C2CKH1_9BACT|nr:hypothetical protein DB30_02627 [Enhygromyxa salina]